MTTWVIVIVFARERSPKFQPSPWSQWVHLSFWICMCITNASSPAGLTLLSLGIDQLIDSTTRRTQKPIYHRQGFYPAAAAFYWQEINLSISYQLIRQQVTTEICEHAQYKPKLWLQKMETLTLMWDGIGGGVTLRRGQLRKTYVTAL